jgi:hypothetical protein
LETDKNIFLCVGLYVVILKCNYDEQKTFALTVKKRRLDNTTLFIVAAANY